MQSFHRFIATGFYSGLTPFAPGTAGTLLATVLLLAVLYFFPELEHYQYYFALFVIGYSLLSVFSSKQVELEWGKDDQRIVADEMAGYWITILFLPWTFTSLLLGVILFRLFDITKPLGVRKMEDLGLGWGVMMDDVLAGVYANCSLRFLLYLFPVLIDLI
ncbi:phosphatidylglycerophosphatase A [Chitinophagales bacterium]|nr:phosphatidylglycerophosphatase A [Chitinophagales bacterium]